MQNPDKTRLIISILLALLLLLTLLPGTRSVLFEKHLFKSVDSAATDYVDAGLIRAGSAFALARTFNAIVSVFQESQLQLEPGGVGVSLALGAALDPLNDLVERFSWVMLVSMTSLGIQKALVEIMPFVSLQILLPMALTCLLTGLWYSANHRDNLLQIGKVLLIVTILLRFAIPAMAYLNNQVYLTFLAEQHNQSVEALRKSVSQLEEQQLSSTETLPVEEHISPAPDEEQSWLEQARITFGQVVDQGKKVLDFKQKLESIKQLTLEMIDRIVSLIVVFVMSTIVLPLLFLWGALKLSRLLLGRGLGLVAEEWLTRKTAGKSRSSQ